MSEAAAMTLMREHQLLHANTSLTAPCRFLCPKVYSSAPIHECSIKYLHKFSSLFILADASDISCKNRKYWVIKLAQYPYSLIQVYVLQTILFNWIDPAATAARETTFRVYSLVTYTYRWGIIKRLLCYRILMNAITCRELLRYIFKTRYAAN